MPQQPDRSIPSLRGAQVLVVDDEALLARGLADLLVRKGFQAMAVASAIEALQSVREDAGRWAVVVTDSSMPVMNGHELRRQIKAIDPGLPVVLMSGQEDDMEPDEFVAQLVKPFRVDELLAVLRPFLPA